MSRLLRMFVLAVGVLSGFPGAAQPDKPALELRTTNGQTRFFIGERISLMLTLTGPDNKKYSIDTAGYDRSGRLMIDTFAVSPAAGWEDPLKQYFSQGMFDGGGLRGSEVLGAKPVSFLADLNEQVRFDEPGTYIVTATSHRVGTQGKGMMPRAPYLAIQSNPIKIEIVSATAEWQAEKLRSIQAILVVPEPRNRIGNPPDERMGAIADLRFLDSEAAIEVLASELREDVGQSQNELMWAGALGLAGVPDAMRDVALHAMSRQLEAPDFPVSAFFLEIMALLEGGPNVVDASPQVKLTDFQASHRPGFRTVWQLALAGLARKQGPALAATADTLLNSAPEGEIAEVKAQISATVVRSFAALPIDRQMWELENRWDELGGQAMLPVLKQLIDEPQPKGSSPFYTAADLNAIVLKRWYELDPEGAVREEVALLASPKVEWKANLVGALPGGPQPQFEAGWAKELVESDDDYRQEVLGALLVRFGTGSATAQVEGKVSELVGKWACAPQAAALAYLVKFKSDNADRLVERAMASTHETACYETLFSTVDAYAHGPALHAAAVTALHNANAGAVADAAEYLRFYGTEAAREPLLERYREWSGQWAGKAGEVDPSTNDGYVRSELGRKLGEALIANQGWLSDGKLVGEVVGGCVGDQVCRELRGLAKEASGPVPHVYLDPIGPFAHYQIGQYGMKSMELFEAKIGQFPGGTKFVLNRNMVRSDEQERLEREAVEMFKRHGMVLEVPDSEAKRVAR